MIAWLTDTLLMTGAIMALILVVRRPIGRWFGPSAAYALWALPMIRLLLPPLVLPHSLAIARTAEVMTPQPPANAPTAPVTYLVETSTIPAPAISGLWDLPWETVLLTIWLAGAALFLVHRAITYQIMRRELLWGARAIGHSGAVRIIESPAVSAPVAFGVTDRVVALPQGFLANADSDASDFAITHELEHHAGNDLIANIAIQPLFALHWFNPVAWMAWRALRSDQEAACDARVMSGRSRRERERYGRLIASFAASSRFALAAPMAGPLKGDKPIIHRLKALVRNEVPERHRLLGRSLFAASIAAVPLTASVTYAAEDLAAESPSAPRQPLAPRASTAPKSGVMDPQEVITVKDGGDPGSSEPEKSTHHRTVVRDGKTIHLMTAKALTDAQVDQVVNRALADGRRAEAHAEQVEHDARRIEADAQRLQQHAERQALDADRISREAVMRAPTVEQSYSADGKVQTLRIVTPARDGQPKLTRTMVIDARCPADEQPVARAVAGNAVAETRVCSGAPHGSRHVAIALSRARASVAANAHMPADVRREILSDLDQEIAEAQSETD